MAEGITVVIPAYNEEDGLAPTVSKLQDSLDPSEIAYEIVVVDDGSSDGTARIAEGLNGVRLVSNPKNMGYGAALKAGIRAAAHDIIVITDADGTYPAARIPDLVAQLTDDTEMVVGWRKGSNAKVPLARRPAKWVLRKFAALLMGKGIPDLNSGLRVFRKSLVARHERLLPSGFSFTTTITLLVMSNAGKVVYVPIEYHRRAGASKFHPVTDVVGMISLIVRAALLFNPLRFFVPISAAFFAAATAILTAALLGAFERIPDATIVILVVTGIQVLFVGLVADLINRRSPS